MKKLVGFALAAGIAVTALSPAEAAQGCGRGFHRGYHGRCLPNARATWVTGRYYHGRGYWDGRRWYQHRERWHGGWRYR